MTATTPIARTSRRPPPAGVRNEVDHDRNALQPVGLPQPVLQVERPLTRDQATIVDLDGEAGRPAVDLGRVVEAQTPATPRGRGPAGDEVTDEPIQLRGGDPGGAPIGELDRAFEELRDVAPGERRAGDDRRPLAQAL